MKYTFQVQWPAPFAKGWKQSGQRFASPRLASEAMAEFLLVSFDNGVAMEGRIVGIQTDG